MAMSTLNRADEINASDNAKVHLGNIHNDQHNKANEIIASDNAKVQIGNNVHHGNNFYDIKNTTEHRDPVVECLVDLLDTDPEVEKGKIENIRGGPLKDAYQWVLDHEDFRTWRDDEQCPMLWIRGGPGKGKTMLSCGIIDELHPSSRLAGEESDTLLTYFFCQGADTRQNNALNVLRGLIYLLCHQQTSLLQRYVLQKHKLNKHLFEGENAWVSLCAIFRNILRHKDLPLTYVIIDALDECEGNLHDLLQFIYDCTKISPRMKWLVTSRNWSRIEGHLRYVKILDLEVNKEAVNAAIEHYIREMVRRLDLKNNYNEETQSTVENYLLKNANGTFLWVALVCQSLRNLGQARSSKILETLKTFPPGLSALYQRMLDQILAFKSCERDVCMRLLAVVATVYRPLSLEELDTFVEHHEEDKVERIVERCGTFLIVREDRTVDFVHQSAKEFLSAHASRLFPCGVEEMHQRLFEQSLGAMLNTLRPDMYSIEHPGIPISGIKTPTPDPLSRARYPCVYWVDHLCNAITEKNTTLSYVLKDDGTLDRFLREKYLYWLEALSLLKNMPAGMKAMTKLETQLNGRTGCSKLLALVQDGRRFIMSFGSVISDAPLQAYASALVFSPEKSIIKQLFKEEMPGWIESRPTMTDKWDACLMTFDGHNEKLSQASIAFSPEGPRVLTASETHGTIDIRDVSVQEAKTQETHIDTASKVLDTAISPCGRSVAMRLFSDTRIWDVAVTLPKRSVCFFHSKKTEITSFSFSDNGKTIALGLDTGHVQLWDPAVRKRNGTLRRNNNRVSSIAVSHDGQYIASRLRYCDDRDISRPKGCMRSEMPLDCSIEIWNTKASRSEKTISGHDMLAGPITFSPQGEYIASGIHGDTFKIWNANTSNCQTAIRGHEGEVTAITFSPDGRRVASGSKDRDIRVWDITTGDCEATLSGHVSGVMSIAFSPDGERIASVSGDSAIKIWDVARHYDQNNLDFHKHEIQSIVLSRDGQRIVSLDQGYLRIWDTTTGYRQGTIGARSYHDTPIVLSPDGLRIASGLDDFNITIWDGRTGCYWYTLKGHVDRVTSIAFSSDGQLIASGSRDRTVRIWDSLHRRCRATFDGHEGEVWSVAISRNGQFVAAGSQRSIKIWNVANRRCQATIRGVFSKPITFSPDGEHIASASRKSVKIWDAMSGCLVVMIPMAHDVQSVSFDKTGNNILTDAGKFKISEGIPPPSQPKTIWHQLLGTTPEYTPHRPDGYGISANKDWITYRGHNILWIPAEYRPQVVAISGLSFAMGCRSKRVVLFRFTQGTPYKHFSQKTAGPRGEAIREALQEPLEKIFSLLSVYLVFIFAFCRPFLWSSLSSRRAGMVQRLKS